MFVLKNYVLAYSNFTQNILPRKHPTRNILGEMACGGLKICKTLNITHLKVKIHITLLMINPTEVPFCDFINFFTKQRLLVFSFYLRPWHFVKYSLGKGWHAGVIPSPFSLLKVAGSTSRVTPVSPHHINFIPFEPSPSGDRRGPLCSEEQRHST